VDGRVGGWREGEKGKENKRIEEGKESPNLKYH